jgi:hypothetical protein
MNTINKKFEIEKYWDKTPIEFKTIITRNYIDEFNVDFTKNKLHHLKQIIFNLNELKYSKNLLLLFHIEKVLIRLKNNDNEYVEIKLQCITNVTKRIKTIKNLNSLGFKSKMQQMLETK